MPLKGKVTKSGAAKSGTPKRMAKQPAQKSQPLPTFSPTHEGDPSRLDTEPNVNSVMDMLVDISSHLYVNEYFVEQMRADKVAGDARRIQSPSLSHATLGINRGCTHRRQALAKPRQPVPEVMADISDAVRPRSLAG